MRYPHCKFGIWKLTYIQKRIYFTKCNVLDVTVWNQKINVDNWKFLKINKSCYFHEIQRRVFDSNIMYSSIHVSVVTRNDSLIIKEGKTTLPYFLKSNKVRSTNEKRTSIFDSEHISWGPFRVNNFNPSKLNSLNIRYRKECCCSYFKFSRTEIFDESLLDTFQYKIVRRYTQVRRLNCSETDIFDFSWAYWDLHDRKSLNLLIILWDHFEIELGSPCHDKRLRRVQVSNISKGVVFYGQEDILWSRRFHLKQKLRQLHIRISVIRDCEVVERIVFRRVADSYGNIWLDLYSIILIVKSIPNHPELIHVSVPLASS